MIAGLSSALSSALSGLLVTSSQSALVSRNVTRANDQDYTRRDVGLTLNGDGTSRIGLYTRSADRNLQSRVLNSSSLFSNAQVTSEALKVLSSTIGDPQDETSVAASLYQLQQSLREFQNNPSSNTYASGAIATARSVASRINVAAEELASVRNEAHQGVEASVKNINSLLSELEPVDRAIRTGLTGTEIYLDSLDHRDRILKQLAEEVGLRVIQKSDGGTALYTDSGITLFDTIPRTVEMQTVGPLTPSVPGPAVYIDGVQVSGTNSIMSIGHGKLAAQLTVRDDMALTYEAQLDETARSLISLFAERDQSATPSLPAATALFTYNGSPTVPPAATLLPGLARSIKINTQFEENPMLLRDGGSNGTGYYYNTSGVSGFQQQLADLADAFDAPMSFDSVARLGDQASLKAFAEMSANRLEAERSKASGIFDEAQANNLRWSEALLSKTGVNLDEEMASLLSLEKSYQASAKVMTTIDQMFSVLVNIVR